MPLRILRLQGLVKASLVQGFLVTRHVLDVLPRLLCLEHASTAPQPSRLGAATTSWTVTVAVLSRGVTARLDKSIWTVSRADRGCRRAQSPACSCSAPSDRTQLLPDDLLACFAIGLGIGNASCPCSPWLWPTFPPLTTGLGSGSPTSPSRSAVPSASPSSARSRRTTKGLFCPPGRDDLLIGSSHLAFVIGAATITAGIVIAVALLRPAPPSPRCNSPMTPRQMMPLTST